MFIFFPPQQIRQEDSNKNNIPVFGICLLDASIAEFSLSEFEDDKYRSNLETILYQTKPKEIIYEKGNLQPATIALLKKILVSPTMTSLNRAECWSSSQTIEKVFFFS